jgi:malate permease and related proteins
MSLFFILLLKVFPLYVNIILGYFSTKRLDVKFISITFISKFIFWPLAILRVIYLDREFYSTLILTILFVVALYG